MIYVKQFVGAAVCKFRGHNWGQGWTTARATDAPWRFRTCERCGFRHERVTFS